jgi:hypothetical protein
LALAGTALIPLGTLCSHSTAVGAAAMFAVGFGTLFASVLNGYVAAAARDLEESGYADACPIATVALEVSSVDEEMRLACAEVFDAWIEGGVWRFGLAGIEPVTARTPVLQMLAGLEGAFVLARALRSTEPIEAAGAAAVSAIRAALSR